MEVSLFFPSLFLLLSTDAVTLNGMLSSGCSSTDKTVKDEKLFRKGFAEADGIKVADNVTKYEEFVMKLAEGTTYNKDNNDLRSFYNKPENERHMEYARYATSVIAYAKKGNIEALYHLACLYLIGLGVPQNSKEALILLRISALCGNAEAQALSGVIYDTGSYGVRQDRAEALRWYQQAAKQGEPESQFKLVIRYYSGVVGSQDLNKALAWASIAISNKKTNESQKRIMENIITEIKVMLSQQNLKKHVK